MSDQPSLSHEPWAELAAAYALDALEPEEQDRLSSHVRTCDLCQRDLNDYTLVAAQLGSLADHDGPPPSWAQISAQINYIERAVTPTVHRLDPAASLSRGDMEPLVPAARSGAGRRRLLAAAAAAVLLTAGGVAGWQLGSRSGPTPTAAALTGCQQQSGCSIVRMHSAGPANSSGDRAAVIVQAGRASLLPLKMTAAPAARMYVLWQMPRDGGPTPIASFRQTNRQTAATLLSVSFADTAAFAVSLEPAGQLPTRPSTILAIGAA
jgi:anti-sigma-K factor RskA